MMVAKRMDRNAPARCVAVHTHSEPSGRRSGSVRPPQLLSTQYVVSTVSVSTCTPRRGGECEGSRGRAANSAASNFQRDNLDYAPLHQSTQGAACVITITQIMVR
jgi:hypothetical protein